LLETGQNFLLSSSSTFFRVESGQVITFSPFGYSSPFFHLRSFFRKFHSIFPDLTSRALVPPHPPRASGGMEVEVLLFPFPSLVLGRLLLSFFFFRSCRLSFGVHPPIPLSCPACRFPFFPYSSRNFFTDRPPSGPVCKADF